MAEAVEKKKNKKWLVILVIVVCIIAIVGGIGLKKQSDYNKPVEYEVKTISFTSFAYNKDLKLIAHRGYRAIAPENTLPAYTAAGTAGYWGAECDVYRTKDGTWVLMHDEDIKRMTDGKGKVESLTYEELQKYTIDNGNGLRNFPDTKVPTLKQYLKECGAYNMRGVIELKGENNTEHYDEIVAMVAESKVKPIYIAFSAEALKAMRKLEPEADMFLLVHKIDDKAIQTAKDIGNCGIDFNADVKNNLKNDGAAIKKITDAKLTAAAWTVDDLETMGKLISYGVLIQTTDCITY